MPPRVAGRIQQRGGAASTSLAEAVVEPDPSLCDEALDVTVERQEVEARAYNHGRALPCLEDVWLEND
jgi:hypothetical protein